MFGDEFRELGRASLFDRISIPTRKPVRSTGKSGLVQAFMAV